MPPVRVLIKPASGMCNMRCGYCFYCDEAAKRQQPSYGMMAPETLKQVIRKCVIPAEGSCTIAFQGGEPTLCGLPFFEQAVEYAEHFNRNRVPVHFALQTNGYGITEEWCRFFARNHFLVGISVDGIRETHDRWRRGKNGEATYGRVLQAVELLDQFQVEYNILTVVHRDTAERIREIYRDYRRRGWNWLQFIPCLDPLGEERGKQPWSLLPEAYGQFLMDLFDEWQADYRKGRAPYIRQFDNWIGLAVGMTPESCEQKGECGLQLAVEADGSVYPCDFYVLDEWRLGNFNRDRLAQIRGRGEELGFCARSRSLPAECRECRWLSICRGGCFRNRIETGTAMGKNYFCRAYSMFFERWAETIREIGREAAKRAEKW